MVRVLSLSVIALVFGSSFAVAADEFAGKWVNTDEKTRGLTRLEIAKNDKSWTIQAWAAGGDGEIDQGKVALHLLVNSPSGIEPKNGIAYFDHKFKDTYLALRLEKDELVIEHFNVFKDDSGRSNYLMTYKFTKGKVSVVSAPLFAGVVIVVRDREGKETKRIQLASGGKVEIAQEEKESLEDLGVQIDDVTDKLNTARDQMLSVERQLSGSAGSRLSGDERAKLVDRMAVYRLEAESRRRHLALLTEKKKKLEVDRPIKGAESDKTRSPAVDSVGPMRKPSGRFTVFAPGSDKQSIDQLMEPLRKTEGFRAADTVTSLTDLKPDDAGVLFVVMNGEGFKKIGKYDPTALKRQRTIGIGYGAAKLFGELGLKIYWGGCAHGTVGEPRLTVIENGLISSANFPSPFFAFEPPILDPKNFHNDFFFGVYLGPDTTSRPNSMDVIALQTADTKYGGVVRQGRNILVGIDAPVDKWSPDLKQLVTELAVSLDAHSLDNGDGESGKKDGGSSQPGEKVEIIQKDFQSPEPKQVNQSRPKSEQTKSKTNESVVPLRKPSGRFTVFAPLGGKESIDRLMEPLRKTHGFRAVETVTALTDLKPDDDGVLFVVVSDEGFKKLGKYDPGALKRQRTIGIGLGAAKLFGELGLEINWGNCAEGTIGEPRLTVTENGLIGSAKFPSPVFAFEPPILDSKDSADAFVFGVFIGPDKQIRRNLMDVIALETTDKEYAAVVRQGRHILVGVDGPVDKWSPGLKRLITELAVSLDTHSLDNSDGESGKKDGGSSQP